ncbi:TetR/AcrR family transcriptional regulator [Arthrobacter halodurans]|uniref:TetR/AcrR family transcriptional regulator n=1 Tax=Arthrobacter halodurans TaxID=516699 RepID=A0ABV4UQT2_9MICC
MTPTSAIPDAALRLLVEQGFDATSVDQLAAAAGMSRSTFFRRFGSKEDMVFADMEAIMDTVRRVLERGRRDPPGAVVDAALAVFDHHTARPDASLLRHRLLQEVLALRDRELVSTHRYEDAFRRGLDAAFGPRAADGDGGARIASVAFAAAVVAVHNAYLRSWLRSPADSIRAELAAELRALAHLFAPRFGGPAGRPGARGVEGDGAADGLAPDPGADGPRGRRPDVVVAVLDPSAGTEAVLAAVRGALEHR